MKKFTAIALFTLFCATTAQAELIANVPLDSSRFERMPASNLANFAQNGNSHAQFFLAKRLQKGQDMPIDAKSAVHWYTEAANQGVAPAQLNLGIMYLKGEGVAHDLVQAKFWLERAAQLGDNRASYALAILEEKEQKLVDAYKWYDLSTREAMLDDTVKNKARSKIGQLALNLSSSEIEAARNRANSWFQNQ